MKLRITTPLDVIVDQDSITSLRAEDDSGSFGIQPGHADFLTTLGISVVSWTTKGGEQHYCAVRRGVLMVLSGREVSIATREAVVGLDLATLDATVLARFRADFEAERTERAVSTTLQIDAIRRMVDRLKPASGNPGSLS